MGSSIFKQEEGDSYSRNSSVTSNQSSSSTVLKLDKEPPVLNDHQKSLLRESWSSLQDDIAKVGVVTFIRLFETHPDFQETFLPFRGLSNSDMENSLILKAHALRVMITVDKCLTRIDSPTRLDDLLKGLGHRHISYNVHIDYIDMMGEQFIKAIRPKFGDAWSSELEVAWTGLFDVMTYHMKRGIIQE
ncbi:hypothetical protein SNE40_013790 [Patella caerulea]|uniref:Globin n=1 Tax=Patella caerulea TaxID=87958 RepID=A0AAN8JFR0_PATCE